VNSLKGVSSRLIKQEFPAISMFWSVKKSHGALWSASYFAVEGHLSQFCAST
jgi:REP element-mobilizing transposase RayT